MSQMGVALWSKVPYLCVMAIEIGNRVWAKVPVGEHGETRSFKGTVDKLMNVDGFGTTARVQFDDALIYGGTGRAWFPTTEIELLE